MVGFKMGNDQSQARENERLKLESTRDQCREVTDFLKENMSHFIYADALTICAFIRRKYEAYCVNQEYSRYLGCRFLIHCKPIEKTEQCKSDENENAHAGRCVLANKEIKRPEVWGFYMHPKGHVLVACYTHVRLQNQYSDITVHFREDL